MGQKATGDGLTTVLTTNRTSDVFNVSTTALYALAEYREKKSYYKKTPALAAKSDDVSCSIVPMGLGTASERQPRHASASDVPHFQTPMGEFVSRWCCAMGQSAPVVRASWVSHTRKMT